MDFLYVSCYNNSVVRRKKKKNRRENEHVTT